MKELKALSPSRIKTLQSCSWKYWCNYHLKIPDGDNDGSKRGTIIHLLLEVLSQPRREKLVKKILRGGSIFVAPPIKRLTEKHSRALNIFNEENQAMIDVMTLAGLRFNFSGKAKGKNVVEDLFERNFDILVDRPPFKYRIRGVIDRQINYDDNTTLIRDYKSSKKAFEGADLDDNIQYQIYTLACKQLEPEKETTMQFLFLKFDLKKEGNGRFTMPSPSKEELRGVEHYLTGVQKVVDNFDEEDARSAFAVDKGFPTDGSFSGKLSCGFAKYKGELKKDGSLMWHCPYKFGFNYYHLLDEDGNIVKGYKEEDVELAFKAKKPNWTVVKKHYGGCPRFVS